MRFGLTLQLLLSALLLLIAVFSLSFAQTVDEITILESDDFHPSWSVMPSVRDPDFGYQEANLAELMSGASESLGYLSVNQLTIGSTRGYQVIGPKGEVFYVDNIKQPKCAIVAQYVEHIKDVYGDLKIGQSSNVVSNVYIEQVDFHNCY